MSDLPSNVGSEGAGMPAPEFPAANEGHAAEPIAVEPMVANDGEQLTTKGSMVGNEHEKLTTEGSMPAAEAPVSAETSVASPVVETVPAVPEMPEVAPPATPDMKADVPEISAEPIVAAPATPAVPDNSQPLVIPVTHDNMPAQPVVVEKQGFFASIGRMFSGGRAKKETAQIAATPDLTGAMKVEGDVNAQRAEAGNNPEAPQGM